MKTWDRLEPQSPDALEDARLQLHWAAQLLSAFGQAFVTPADDDSHRSMIWDRDRRLLATSGRHEPSGLRLALRPRDLTLLLEGDGRATEPFELAGRPLEAGRAWLEQRMAAAPDAGAGIPVTLPDYEMPDHRVASGQPFGPVDDPRLRALERWYDNSAGLLDGIGAGTEQASPTRCWPHHFDIATLITLADAGGGRTRTVGLGMTPGDVYYREPYFYVTPYPRPATVQPPDLPAGHWHTHEWFGAVLAASELLEEPTADGQEALARKFLLRARALSTALLE